MYTAYEKASLLHTPWLSVPERTQGALDPCRPTRRAAQAGAPPRGAATLPLSLSGRCMMAGTEDDPGPTTSGSHCQSTARCQWSRAHRWPEMRPLGMWAGVQRGEPQRRQQSPARPADGRFWQLGVNKIQPGRSKVYVVEHHFGALSARGCPP